MQLAISMLVAFQKFSSPFSCFTYWNQVLAILVIENIAAVASAFSLSLAKKYLCFADVVFVVDKFSILRKYP